MTDLKKKMKTRGKKSVKNMRREVKKKSDVFAEGV
jgi:hypothetical protein